MRIVSELGRRKMTTPKFREAKVIEVRSWEVLVEYLDTKEQGFANPTGEMVPGEIVAITTSPKLRSYMFDYNMTPTAIRLKGEII